MQRRGVQARFEGIGAARMRAAGFRIVFDTRGWSSMGPVDALTRIVPLLAKGVATALRLRRDPPDLIVLVDFGAFNLRLAALLRRLGYVGPILYYFPPGAWLDDERRARTVARRTVALTPFAHQRDFYASLGLPIAYFGHPLMAAVAPPRERRPVPAGGAHVALLPGSRRGELERHVPILLGAFDRIRERRPAAHATFVAADAEAETTLRAAAAGRPQIAVRRGTAAALADADAAAVASGTAVLEAMLAGVPSVAFYVVSPAQVKIAERVLRRRIFGGRFVTVPNLVLQREAIPEYLAWEATPEAIGDALERVLNDPSGQLEAGWDLRRALGDEESLDRCAAFAIDLLHR